MQIIAASGVCPAIVWEFGDEGKANARLLAASWDMREACKLTMAWWGDHKFDTMPCGDGDEMNVYDDEPPMVTAARAALAKSRGEAQ